jgi:hypothetical protein
LGGERLLVIRTQPKEARRLSGASHAATPVANRSAAKVGMRALFGVEFIRGPSPKCGPRVPESERFVG